MATGPMVAARAKAKAMHEAKQPLEIWEIDFLLERCEQVVADFAEREHQQCEGVPAVEIRQRKVRRHGHVLDAARAILEESEP
jgi:hypothetical protein